MVAMREMGSGGFWIYPNFHGRMISFSSLENKILQGVNIYECLLHARYETLSMQSVIYFHNDPVQEESLPFCILQMRKQKQRNHIGGGKIS